MLQRPCTAFFSRYVALSWALSSSNSRHFWRSDWLRNRLILVAIADHKVCYFKFQKQSWDGVYILSTYLTCMLSVSYIINSTHECWGLESFAYNNFLWLNSLPLWNISRGFRISPWVSWWDLLSCPNSHALGWCAVSRVFIKTIT